MYRHIKYNCKKSKEVDLKDMVRSMNLNSDKHIEIQKQINALMKINLEKETIES